MTPSSLAGIITAIASGITALALLCAALPTLIKVLRRTAEVREAIAEVHVIVNQQRTDMGNYQRALERALQDAGIAVPIDQSKTESK
jgi:hypothetical protein